MAFRDLPEVGEIYTAPGATLVTPLPLAVSRVKCLESPHHPLESPCSYLNFFFRVPEQEQGAFCTLWTNLKSLSASGKPESDLRGHKLLSPHLPLQLPGCGAVLRSHLRVEASHGGVEARRGQRGRV